MNKRRSPLERRVERIEALLSELQMRLSALAGWYEEAVDAKIRGQRIVRGNDGVALQSQKLKL